MQIGEDLLVLWHASLGGGLSPSTGVDLMRAQRPELLVGQPETARPSRRPTAWDMT
jgi:hypothetical protein